MLDRHIEVTERIMGLRKRREAVVLAHNYQPSEVQDMADFIGDSLDLSQKAAGADVEVIVFCGVHFVPDQCLGHYISTKTSKRMILWPGYCPTRTMILPEEIRRLRQEYPKAKVIVHPECRPDVIALADEVLSTSEMVKFVQKTQAKEIIVATEIGLIPRLKKENPSKKFVPASEQAGSALT